ncbi:MAG: hypothetical protein XD84_0157 [Desulfotomaculum sp. 46_80]|nr:MAG: hypothetical protein XD84_0157 [Desulfotomaculum sp. 46_80]HAG08897.1 hypothetical protein [Desulfotomaculum sp.]HAU32732.1 hypothetical protein [Desulfotomaculum sp.]
MKKLICARRHQRNFLFPSKKNSNKQGSSAMELCVLKALPVRYIPLPGERPDDKLAVKFNQGDNKKPAAELETAAGLTDETK